MKLVQSKEIEKAYKEVIKKHSYKYKKRLCNAIFWEMFFSGVIDIKEDEIKIFVTSL